MTLKIILLIIPKLILKIVGYLAVGILKASGFVICAFSHVCGWVTNTIGAVLTLLAIVYTVCGFLGAAGLNRIDCWWVTSIVVGILGIVIATLSIWVELLGDKLTNWGDTIAINLGEIKFLSTW